MVMLTKIQTTVTVGTKEISMNTQDSYLAEQAKSSDPRFYLIAWRWHFYSGLYVVPFLLMLAVTGLVMVFFTGFQSRLGTSVHVQANAPLTAVTVQAKAALKAFPENKIKEYISPKSSDLAAWIVLSKDDQTHAIAVNPYSAEVIKVVDPNNTVFAWAQKVHGTLLIGDIGDRLIEIAAGLGVVMILTGLYLHWPRNGSTWSQALLPNFKAKGRMWWKSMHASIGFIISVVLFLFLLTGLAWTGVWGDKIVKPWATFPAAKWDDVPKSTATHSSLNDASLHDVPWGLELTLMPQSGSDAGKPGVLPGEPINLDGVSALAKRLGFVGQFHINVPQDANGVYTISADSMSGDLSNPFKDRTVHVDRNTGKVLVDVGYSDYSMIAKAMAVGIALHQGDVGLWSALVNVVFCLAVAFMCISGIVIWWKRRPQGKWQIGAPAVPQELTTWKSGAIVMCIVGLAFPLSGAVLLSLLILDWAVFSKIKSLKQIIS
jgi:uncharacterized iron-regulated membrane protein